MSLLPVKRAHAIDDLPPALRWMVEDLWGAESVGVIGGEPKLGKSTLALHLAIAVASGQPCLGRFAVKINGRVLLYAAEDPYHVVRQRLEAIAAAGGLALADLGIYLITAPQLRLDQQTPREELAETIAKISPKLLILDPFVRLHSGIDENAVSAVAPILAHLRYLQRSHHLAVAIVHHARKAAAHIRPGQALRGSSEFHAWGDSNLYLRDSNGRVRLTVEHRAAKGPPDLILEHHGTDNGAATLRIVDAPSTTATDGNPPSLESSRERVEKALAAAAQPLTVRELQQSSRARTDTVCDILRDLVAQGRVEKLPHGYQLLLPLPKA